VSRRFQYSLGRLLASTTLIGVAVATYTAATQSDPPWSMLQFVAACTVCGCGCGCLVRLAVPGTVLGFITSIGLLIYAIETSGI
jgi:FtsH-binding integral membrane protein